MGAQIEATNHGGGPDRDGRRAEATARPLVLDLDGTLIRSDLLAETLLLFLKRRPFQVWRLAIWLLQGRAVLKRRLAERTTVHLDTLPAQPSVVAYAEAAAAEGRPVYLATAADAGLAGGLLVRFGFLSEVIGSEGGVNLKGVHKARALAARFPEGFDYVGDASADWPVWSAATGVVFAGRSARLARRVDKAFPGAVRLPAPGLGLRQGVKALRLHQWSKNALLFVPLLLGGKAGDLHTWAVCVAGFIGLGLVASASYLLNDLLDLADDRAHWSKRQRALASGLLSPWRAMGLLAAGAPAGLLLVALVCGLPAAFSVMVYLGLTLSYSFGLKRVPMLDVAILGALFTLRLAIGVVCAQVAWSAWLLVFSMFLFSSLSFAKRFTEIDRSAARGGAGPSGRGYVLRDAPLVLAMGVALTVAAILVMVLYLTEEAFKAHFYHHPQGLWVVPIGLALWLGRVWLLCARGELNDDPVAFAVRDPVSLTLGAALAVAVAAVLFL